MSRWNVSLQDKVIPTAAPRVAPVAHPMLPVDPKGMTIVMVKFIIVIHPVFSLCSLPHRVWAAVRHPDG
jgi:hypothetical protein